MPPHLRQLLLPNCRHVSRNRPSFPHSETPQGTRLCPAFLPDHRLSQPFGAPLEQVYRRPESPARSSVSAVPPPRHLPVVPRAAPAARFRTHTSALTLAGKEPTIRTAGSVRKTNNPQRTQRHEENHPNTRVGHSPHPALDRPPGCQRRRFGGTTQQQCKASEDGAGCENANAKCKTSGGVDGKCTVSSIPSNPCRCIPGN